VVAIQSLCLRVRLVIGNRLIMPDVSHWKRVASARPLHWT